MKYRVTVITKEKELPVGTVVELRKQPDNAFDNEAIKVVAGQDEVGYVSAFYKTRKPGTISAGRIYDKISDVAVGQVVENGIVLIECGQ